jgi:hypothetical protein
VQSVHQDKVQVEIIHPKVGFFLRNMLGKKQNEEGV